LAALPATSGAEKGYGTHPAPLSTTRRGAMLNPVNRGEPMKRRDFIAGIASAAACPVRGHAQQSRNKRKIGVLMSIGEGDPDAKSRVAALLQGLGDLGWNDGGNIHIDYRWGAGQPKLLHQYALELVALEPDVILANGTPAVVQLKPLTNTIPIVCALIIDPVGLGLIESLSRPGGNITGFSFIDPELIGKWTALLKEAVPNAHRAVLLYNPTINPWYANFLRDIAAAPQSVALEVVPTVIEAVDDLQTRIPDLARTPDTGLIIGPEAFVVGHFQEVAALAQANRLPGISVYRQFAVEGGLMSYGPDIADIFRRSAAYVDRILKGATPATLPVQQPTKFEFIINQKAAGALGLSLPSTLLARADEVIE
jgi:putative tryptophan/tyrosine transport system substrate-binding protein